MVTSYWYKSFKL